MNANIFAMIACGISMIIFTYVLTKHMAQKKRIQEQDRDAERALENIHQDKERKDDQIFEKIVGLIGELYDYRIRGGATERISETKRTSEIYNLSLQFQTDNYAAILPQIQEFGEKYKDEIPPRPAQADLAAIHDRYIEKIRELKSAIDKFWEK